MTREILDSDVEFAQRRMEAGRSDNELVTALGFRGIEPDRAAHVVKDLRSGKRIRPNMILVPKRVRPANRPA